MQWCVIGRGVQWGQRRRRWPGPRGGASWPPSSLARLALLSPPEASGCLHTYETRHIQIKKGDAVFDSNVQTSETKPHADQTAGPHAWPDWTEQRRLSRSGLCSPPTGSDQTAGPALQLLSGLLLLAPPPLSPPSSPSLHPLQSDWPPATQRSGLDV